MKQKHNVTAEKLGITISSGTMAGLASGAVTISLGETVLFVYVESLGSRHNLRSIHPLEFGIIRPGFASFAIFFVCLKSACASACFSLKLMIL